LSDSFNEAGGKSDITLHFNRLPLDHPADGAVQPNETKVEVHEISHPSLTNTYKGNCFAQESAEEEKNGAGVKNDGQCPSPLFTQP
jgi:hypothetical protein